MSPWELKLYQILDAGFIHFYRFLPDPVISFFVGTFLVAFVTVVIGEFSISLAFLANRRYVEKLNNELIKWNNLSVEAIEAGDKESYKSCNDQANEVFGKVFFLSLAYAASSLWPVPFALGWMQYRFQNLELPLPVSVPHLGDRVGFIALFIILYILTKFIFSYLKPHLPYFKKIEAMLAVYEQEQAKMKSFGDLLKNSLATREENMLYKNT
ncbi:hypothetical protein [Desulfovulcanus sp.]